MPRVARRAKRGGARRSRTDDILLAKQALYQLSYGPLPKDSLVGPTRFELVTSRLSSVRSNQLSYGPIRQKQDHSRPGLRCTTNLSDVRMTSAADCVLERETKTAANRIYLLSDIPIVREHWRNILRKEVIQPQVPLRLPCYDFTPVADPTVVACLLAVSAAPSGRTNSHGVTGGVYKARERIHRGMLIRDY